jgi:nucleoside-diphosphate-sugar epimerase
MKALFIGGTGLISSACSHLALERGIELFILNRGRSSKYPVPAGATLLVGDIHDQAAIRQLLDGQHFDCVVDWVAFTPQDVQNDINLFAGKTRQYVFISSASAYQKPPAHYLITEDTPLVNPFWEYSRNKIACEDLLMKAHREQGFPSVIVRPSHTYGPSQIPLCVSSWLHPWTVPDRMLRGQKVIVPGDGTSLWVLTWNGDFAKGFVGLMGRETTLGQAFHITSDEVLTWNQIYTEAAHALGVEPKLIHIPGDLLAAYDPSLLGGVVGDKGNSVVFDNRKIKRWVPDYVATLPWSEGARRSIAWFQADPSRQTIDAEANVRWDTIIASYERARPN